MAQHNHTIRALSARKTGRQVMTFQEVFHAASAAAVRAIREGASVESAQRTFEALYNQRLYSFVVQRNCKSIKGSWSAEVEHDFTTGYGDSVTLRLVD
jgi:hypothetical protein